MRRDDFERDSQSRASDNFGICADFVMLPIEEGNGFGVDAKSVLNYDYDMTGGGGSHEVSLDGDSNYTIGENQFLKRNDITSITIDDFIIWEVEREMSS